MGKFNTINEILDFAIQSEQEAVEFYTELSTMAESQEIKMIFLDYAKEEMGHKAKLLQIKEGNWFVSESAPIVDLKISDYLAPVEISSEMTYQQALVTAMKREKAAFRLYTTLASKTENVDLTEIFLLLAQEEAKHKLRFEVEYDEYILKEN
ncbi:MAG: ferritin family protein [Bacteroidales bacterium]|nr:ferritin family protein [Bacteroidales bacterium]